MTSAIMPTLSGHYPVFISKTVRNSQPWFMAELPDLPGCLSDGPTPQDAVENLDEARQLYIDSLVEDGIAVPEPFSAFSQSLGTAGIGDSEKTAIVEVQKERSTAEAVDAVLQGQLAGVT